MYSMGKTALVLVVISALILVPLNGAALAQGDDLYNQVTAPQMMVDVIGLRPLGLLATVLGTAFFVVGYPLAWLGGDTERPAQKLVVDPFNFTFKRRLGDF